MSDVSFKPMPLIDMKTVFLAYIAKDICFGK